MSDAEILFERRGSLGLITLNRPKALNALSLAMIREMALQLTAWEKDCAVGAIAICGAGDKAFCAGGDVRAVYEDGLAARRGQSDGRLTHDFFAEEYRLNAQIAALSKPYIAILDGIVMGGGAGLSIHGRWRLATERMSFAMPECGIGLFPDIGATYFLNRCPGALGLYLALTGKRIGPGDCLYAGLVTHGIDAERIAELIDALTILPPGADSAAIETVIRQFGAVFPPSALQTAQGWIDRVFAAESVETIWQRLGQENNGEAGDALKAMKGHCPLSLKVTLEQLRRGRAMSLEQALAIEFCLSQNFMRGDTVYEGIRAQLVDKDRSPRWQPATLAEVSAAMVETYFKDKP